MRASTVKYTVGRRQLFIIEQNKKTLKLFANNKTLKRISFCLPNKTNNRSWTANKAIDEYRRSCHVNLYCRCKVVIGRDRILRFFL